MNINLFNTNLSDKIEYIYMCTLKRVEEVQLDLVNGGIFYEVV